VSPSLGRRFFHFLHCEKSEDERRPERQVAEMVWPNARLRAGTVIQSNSAS